ncbi:DDE-type integrase/transposase/recombinase [Bacillus mycoides]|uniref:DDE-type integrase/transposase/recombinase n=1 Tax=Bacillus nitratireducens TaxID=2026193 RepID=A0ABU6PL70_9BACI|nr:DDE-type integrase/transposase/recombinase [Bacillus mycoides]MED4682039.1 DDE-type integrase/transposase/recombinase [Bacillus nitratireducens]
MTLKKVRDQYGKAKFIQVEQDHRFIKKRVRSMLGLKSFRTATSIISGIEAMHMVKKGQLILLDKSVQNQVKFIHQLFGIVA